MYVWSDDQFMREDPGPSAIKKYTGTCRSTSKGSLLIPHWHLCTAGSCSKKKNPGWFTNRRGLDHVMILSRPINICNCVIFHVLFCRTSSGMTKSFSTNTISTSTPSKDKKGRESKGVDLIAELKAANGMASLKRAKNRDAGTSQYYGASSAPSSPPDDVPDDGSSNKTFKSVRKLKALVNVLQSPPDEKAQVKPKVSNRQYVRI